MSRPGDPPSGAGVPSEARLSEREFAERFVALGPLLWTVAAAVCGDPGEADDVLQEAGMVALARRDQYRPGTNFQAWIARIVRFVALNHGRKGHRRRALSLSGTLPAQAEPVDRSTDPAVEAGGWAAAGAVGPNGELLPDAEAFDDRMLDALRRLGAVPRACLLLRTVHELSYREIATTLELPEGTAMSHVHRARVRLRSFLLEDEASAVGEGPHATHGGGTP